MMNLTRNQRRQLEKLAPHIDKVLADDISFFNRHPDRQHRVRLTTDVEIAQVETINNAQLPTPVGQAWYTLVRKVPGARLRVFVCYFDDSDTGLDVSEAAAQATFDAVAPEHVRELEKALRAKGAQS
jgi:hypothetical protein